MSAPIPPDELSVRSPEEILAMSFSDSDLYLGDGLFAKGQCGAVIGPAGVGKSRIVTQIACSFILGTPFMGVEVGASDKTCLFLQSENSNRRLKDQLSKQIATYTDAQRKRINARLHIKTVENDRDANLRMNSSANIDAIARLMNEIEPDVIFVDPLNAFAKGSLTSADGMLATLHGLQALARNANPDAALIVVHHALANAKAFRDAVGPNRGSYGRDSKTLHGWSRGTINIAPGDPGDTRKILLACGKNSNGREFDPFGAVLNTDTMLYERDAEFTLERWKALMGGESVGSLGLSPDRVAEFVQERAMTKAELVAEIMKETGCQKTKAYDAIRLAEDSTIIRTTDRQLRAIKVE